MASEADILSAALTRMNINKHDDHQPETEDLNVRQLLWSRMKVVPNPVPWQNGIVLMTLPCGHKQHVHLVYTTCRIPEQDARDYACHFCGNFILNQDDLDYLDRVKGERELMDAMSDEEFWTVYPKHDFGVMSGVSLPTVQVVEALANALASLSDTDVLVDEPEIVEVQTEVQHMLDNAPRDVPTTLNLVLAEIFEKAGLDFEDGNVAQELQQFLQGWVARAETLLKSKVEKDVDSVAAELSKMMIGGA